MNIEDTIFTKARLGRHWTPARAEECLSFFPARYAFNAATERAFIDRQPPGSLDYSDNLKSRLSIQTMP